MQNYFLIWHQYYSNKGNLYSSYGGALTLALSSLWWSVCRGVLVNVYLPALRARWSRVGLVCSMCHLPWWNYSSCGQFQPVNVMSLGGRWVKACSCSPSIVFLPHRWQQMETASEPWVTVKCHQIFRKWCVLSFYYIRFEHNLFNCNFIKRDIWSWIWFNNWLTKCLKFNSLPQVGVSPLWKITVNALWPVLLYVWFVSLIIVLTFENAAAYSLSRYIPFLLSSWV